MEGNDWDLFAVVRRGCRRFRESTSEVADPFPSYASLLPLETGNNKAGNNLVDESDYRVSGFEELEEFLKPYFSKPYQSQPSSSSAPPAVKASVEPTVRVPPRPPNRRRRRNQQKKVVCHVPADSLSSDMWAWRKYGQKPIKGSPYPRGYYRCSSSKGCLARKQMERSRSDPGMFIITYTAEHNHPVPTHRNSLAGSTRHKVPSPPHSANRPRPPSPATAEAAELSPTTPLTASTSTEEEEEDEGMLVVEDMEVLGEDDFLIMGDQHSNPTASASKLSAFDDNDDEDFDPFFAQPWLFANTGSKAAAAGGS